MDIVDLTSVMIKALMLTLWLSLPTILPAFASMLTIPMISVASQFWSPASFCRRIIRPCMFVFFSFIRSFSFPCIEEICTSLGLQISFSSGYAMRTA